MITKTRNNSKVSDISNTGTKFANPATYVGLSTDTKPTGADNADAFLEMDTGDVYLFDEANIRWIKQEN